MTIKYKVSYLSDGTKVKITSKLYNQFKQWKMQGIHIPMRFKNELKIQDNDWLNSYRQYYRHNTSLDLFKEKNIIFESILKVKNESIERIAIRRELIVIVLNALDKCTKAQKRRFIKHFAYCMSYEAIAKQENCTKRAVEKSIKAAEQMLINCEQLLWRVHD